MPATLGNGRSIQGRLKRRHITNPLRNIFSAPGSSPRDSFAGPRMVDERACAFATRRRYWAFQLGVGIGVVRCAWRLPLHESPTYAQHFAAQKYSHKSFLQRTAVRANSTYGAIECPKPAGDRPFDRLERPELWVPELSRQARLHVLQDALPQDVLPGREQPSSSNAYGLCETTA
jgi:hypothetical protein